MPKLKTNWYEGGWGMFILIEERNAATEHAIVEMSRVSNIKADPIYKKYIKKELNNIESGILQRKNFAKHKPGYRRLFLLSLITMFVGFLGLGIAFIQQLTVGTAESILVYIFAGLGFVSFAVGIGLFISAQSSQANYQHLKKLLRLIDQIEEAQTEIVTKNRLVVQFTQVIEKSMPQEKFDGDQYKYFKSFVALAFDKKDDLEFYEKASVALNKLTRIPTSFYQSGKSRQEIFESVIFELLKAKFGEYKNYCNAKQIEFKFVNFFRRAKSFDALINKIIVDDKNQETKIFIMGAFGEVLQNDNCIKPLIDITFWLTNVCSLEVKQLTRNYELSVIKIFYDCFLTVSDFKALQTSILMLLDDIGGIKQRNILNYINKVFNKNYHNVAAIFKETVKEQLKANVETISNVLESKYQFRQLMGDAVSQQKPATVTPQFRSGDFIKLTISDNAVYLRKDRQTHLQEGWNCGDIALSIERDWLVKKLLKKAGVEKLRSLLAPEIKTAIAEGTIEAAFGDKTAEAKRYFQDYENAQNNMDAAVAVCNDGLGKGEGERLSLQELDIFFENLENQAQHQETWRHYSAK